MRLATLLLFVLAGCGPDDAGGARAGSSAGGPAESAAPPSATSDPVSGPGDAPGPEASGEPGAPGGLRVLFVGTSLTAGLGLLRNEERYTSRLQAMADSAGLSTTMVNAGVSGETSAGGLRRLEWLLDDPVDVLVVELGANDGLRGQDPEALEANLRALVERARERRPGLPVVLLGMEAPPNMGPAYVRSFREVFGEVAEDADAALVPFLLEGVAGVPDLNQEDGIHPTAEGHRRMARNVWPVLEPVLRRELARPRPADGSGGP